MLPQDENNLFELCEQAMHEDDTEELLRVFLALDRAARLGTRNGSILSEEAIVQTDRARKSKQDPGVAFEA
jgi:Trp operon repressor